MKTWGTFAKIVVPGSPGNLDILSISLLGDPCHTSLPQSGFAKARDKKSVAPC